MILNPEKKIGNAIKFRKIIQAADAFQPHLNPLRWLAEGLNEINPNEAKVSPPAGGGDLEGAKSPGFLNLIVSGRPVSATCLCVLS